MRLKNCRPGWIISRARGTIVHFGPFRLPVVQYIYWSAVSERQRNQLNAMNGKEINSILLAPSLRVFPICIKFPPLPVIRVISSIVPFVAGCIEKRILYMYSAIRIGEIRIEKLQHCV